VVQSIDWRSYSSNTVLLDRLFNCACQFELIAAISAARSAINACCSIILETNLVQVMIFIKKFVVKHSLDAIE
jgi:hypothetical protein